MDNVTGDGPQKGHGNVDPREAMPPAPRANTSPIQSDNPDIADTAGLHSGTTPAGTPHGVPPSPGPVPNTRWVPIERLSSDRHDFSQAVGAIARRGRIRIHYARHSVRLHLSTESKVASRRVALAGRAMRRAGVWPGRFAQSHPFPAFAIAVAILLGLPLFTFLATPERSAAARLTVGIGAQGTQMSADKAATGSAPAWTNLVIQPSIEESNPGEIGSGILILKAPSGFEFDTGSPAIALTVSQVAGALAATCDTAANGTGTKADVTNLTSSTILITITRASTGTSKCLLTFSNIRVRPLTTTAPFSGSITKSSTGYSNSAVIAGIVDGVTSFGDLTTTPGAFENSASSSRSLSTSTVALNKTQLAVGGSVTASLYLKDAYGNSITTTPAGIGAASFGTKTTVPLLADCATATTVATAITGTGAQGFNASITFSSAGTVFVYACITPPGGTAGLFTSTAQVSVNTPPTVTSVEITRILADNTTTSGTSIGISATARTRTVTVKGTNFQANATAAFDGMGLTVASVTRTDASTLTISLVIAANASAGSRSITVTNPDGGTVSFANAVTLTSPPSGASLSQTVYGSGSSGAVLNLTATNILAGVRVRIDPNPGDITFTTQWNSSTQVTLTMAIASTARTTAERRTIYLDNRDESGEVAALTQLQIAAPPTVTVVGITPNNLGRGAGTNPATRLCDASAPGVAVTVPGTGFSANALTGTVQATFSNSSNDVTTTVTSVSATALVLKVCVTSGAAATVRNLSVVNGDGGLVSATSALTINGSPLITAISEASIGQGATARTLTVTGGGFSPQAKVSLQRIPSSQVGTGSTVVCNAAGNTTTVGTASDIALTTVSVTARTTSLLSTSVTIGSDAETGPVWVKVDNDDQGSDPVCSLAGLLTVTPRPTASSITPSYLNPPVSGSSTVTLALGGANFGSGTTVSVLPATGQSSADVAAVVGSAAVGDQYSMTFDVTVPATALGGTRGLLITNLDGGTKTIPNAVTVVSTGSVTVSPTVIGAGAVSAPLTIFGTGLNASSNVTFGRGATSPVLTTDIVAGQVTAGADGTSLTVLVTVSPATAADTYTMTITSPDSVLVSTSGTFVVTSGPVIAAVGRSAANAGTSAVQYGQNSSAQTLYLSGSNFKTANAGATVPVVSVIDGAGNAVAGVTVSGVTVASGGGSLTATVAVGTSSTAGSYAVQVVNPDRGSVTFANAFEVTVRPTITAITDNTNFGAGAESKTVTLSGTNFSPQATVRFTRTGDTTGSQVTQNYAISSAVNTRLAVNITIAATATTGTRSIVVTNPDGGSATLSGVFTVNTPPSITTITPSALGANRSYVVTLRGSNFQSNLVEVKVGSGAGYASTLNMAIDSTVGPTTLVNNTTITFGIRIDVGAAVGYRTITLTNADGGMASIPFYVNAALGFTEVSPKTVGLGATEYTVTVTGQGFSTTGLMPQVRFLNETTFAADPLLAVDDNKTVMNEDGTVLTVKLTVASTATLGTRALQIDLQNGTPLIVKRSSLDCAKTTAGVGTPTPTPTADCFVFSVVAGPSVTAVSPRVRRQGAVDAPFPTVTVTPTTGPNVTATATALPSATATLVPGQSAPPVCPQPTEPSPETTMRIAICGGNFDNGVTASVTYPDSASAADNGITVVSTERKNDHLLWVLLKFDLNTFQVATAKSGKRTVTVTNGDGGSSSLLTTSAYAFEVVNVPTITGVSFTGTPTAGQTVQIGVGAVDKVINIAGTNFVAGARTAIDMTPDQTVGIHVTSVVVNSATSITAKVSVDENVQIGARKLVLTNDDGGATVQSTLDLVTIVSPPSFSSIQLGETLGVTTVGRGATSVTLAIRGSGFSANPVVSFGANSGITVKPGLSAVNGQLISGQIDVGTGAAAGSRDLYLSNADGGTVIVPNAITVNTPPSLTGISPSNLGIGSKGTLVISGVNFATSASVSFQLNGQTDSTITVTKTRYVSSSRVEIDVQVSSNALPGGRGVVFNNGDGSPVLVTPTGTFNVNSPPTFAYMSPDTIAPGGVITDAVIAGTGFLPTTKVSVSGTGISVATPTFVSATLLKVNLTATSDATAGLRDLVFDPGDGSATVTAPNRLTVVAGMSVTTVAPDGGTPGTTVTVTISGNGFAPPALVAFGDGITVSNVVVSSASEIKADLLIDAGATSGARGVTVTIAGKSISVGSKFTVLGAPPPTAVPAPAAPAAPAKPVAVATAVPTATEVPTATLVPTATPLPTATPFGLMGLANGISLQAAVADAGTVGEATLGGTSDAPASVNFVAPPGVGVSAVVEARDPAVIADAVPALKAANESGAVQVRRSIQVNLYDNTSGRKLVEHDEPVVIRMNFDASDFEAAGSDPDRLGIVVVRPTADATPICPAGAFLLPAKYDGDARTLTISTRCTSAFSVVVLSDGLSDVDYEIQGGRFFTQASGFGGRGGVGYALIDDGQASFAAEFVRRGDLKGLGYPSSRRFTRDGFPVQVFQKFILQWRADRNEAVVVNVFDELHARGYDTYLNDVHGVPPPFDMQVDEDLSYQEVLRLHVGNILNGRDLAGTAISGIDPQAMLSIQKYIFKDDDWLNQYGLPVSVARFPSSIVVRMQRAAFQYWLEDLPWASAGQITVVLGGDLAKQAGLYRNEDVSPELPQAYQRVKPVAATPTPENSPTPTPGVQAGAMPTPAAAEVKPAVEEDTSEPTSFLAPIWNAVVETVRTILPDWLLGPLRAGLGSSQPA